MHDQNIRRKLLINQLLYTLPSLRPELETLQDLCADLKLLNEWLNNRFKEQFVKVAAYFQEKHIEKVERTVQDLALNVISIEEKLYPQGLLDLPDPPIVVFAKGNTELLQQPNIGIVGTRQASAYGVQATRLFSSKLSEHFGIVSGLAQGIDAEAHHAALQQPKKTIAVCACGLDTCYPYQNQNLFQKIAEEACLLSEFPLFSKPLKFHFLHRNRLIAALSSGLLIIEAGFKSGALNTVQHALDLGKEVFVTPSSIFSPQAQGSLKLLKEGGICVTDPKDILDYYLDSAPVQKALFEGFETSGLNEASQKILGALNQFPMHLDDLAKHTQLPLTTVLSNLTELELDQKVDIKGGYVSKLFS